METRGGAARCNDVGRKSHGFGYGLYLGPAACVHLNPPESAPYTVRFDFCVPCKQAPTVPDLLPQPHDKTLVKAVKLCAVAKKKELEKYEQREHAFVAEKSGFQFYAAAMEKQSLTQGQGHKEMLRRVAAHRHGEDFNADIDNEYSLGTRWA